MQGMLVSAAEWIRYLNLSYFNDTQILVILVSDLKTAKFNRQICMHVLTRVS